MTERTDLPPLATRAEAAAALRVSVRTVDRLIADGKLTAITPTARAVRIPISSIQNLLNPGALAASPSHPQAGAPDPSAEEGH